jgi:primary-amine oxidase
MTSHPLDPLNAEEIRTAVAIVARTMAEQGRSPDDFRFPYLWLEEPSKAEVAAGTSQRKAFAAVLDKASGVTHEAIISLSEGRIERWSEVTAGQPSLMVEEFFLIEAVVKADPRFRAALAARGITDVDLVQVDPLTAGSFGLEVEPGRRLSRAVSYWRDDPKDNGYAHPIEGLSAYVDLVKGEVVEVIDTGALAVPREPGRYDPASVGNLRTDLKPLEVHQPEGVSFAMDGHLLTWQRWRMRVSLHPREGLVLHDVAYYDVPLGGAGRPGGGEGEWRQILYRAAVSEMVVPYGDPRDHCFFRNAFDVGEYGLGKLVGSLSLGCDCLGEIHYLDATLADDEGNPMELTNAICIHEEDFGILWKHWDFRQDTSEVRRMRRLVVSVIATIGDYEYGFYWYFHEDGSIGHDIKLTGIVQTLAEPDGPVGHPYGALVAPNVSAPNHQHLFNFRLDFDLDGEANSVVEMETVGAPVSDTNPWGNAMITTETVLATEQAAIRRTDPSRARLWKVINPNRVNRLGKPVGYRLVPGGGAPLVLPVESSIGKRAGFAANHLWVTPFDPAERWAAGNYPNQHPGGDGLPAYTAADRPIENTDIVVWHTLGVMHVARPEDWPVMPVEVVSFHLKPDGFFDRNPSLDVAPPPVACH